MSDLENLYDLFENFKIEQVVSDYDISVYSDYCESSDPNVIKFTVIFSDEMFESCSFQVI